MAKTHIDPPAPHTGRREGRLQRRSFTTALLLAGAAAASRSVAGPAPAGQDYPRQPIKLIVPFPSGGTSDLVARLLADHLGPLLGGTVVVENRGGAGGTLGSQAVAQAAADGYTLLLATVSTHGASPAIYNKLPYDPVKDFQPISHVMSVPSVFAVNPALPARTLQEFIALARAKPRSYTYASPGNGSLGHANVENFSQLAGIELLHVPYKGAGPAMNDVLAGVVHAITDNLPSALPFVQAGKLRALAVLAPQRSPALPDVPTYREQGFDELSQAGWFGLMAPAHTSAAVIARLAQAVHTAVLDDRFMARAQAMGGTAMANSPAQFALQVQAALERYRRVAAAAHIHIN